MNERENNYEIIVGIPSYMESDSIGYVTRQVDCGLNKYFPNLNSVIINVDNNSKDGTKEAFIRTDTLSAKIYITTPKGVRGKGHNIFNFFNFAAKHYSTLKAVIVVDADLKSITPDWVKYLVEPILEGYDYVLPLYSRHQFDGTITNHICHPLIYGLLGMDIRQPIGGEFAFSPALLKHWLKQNWFPTVKLYGIDIFMTLHAIIGKFNICQAKIGAKIHKPSGPKLGAMFIEVITTFFEIISESRDILVDISMKTVRRTPVFGVQRLIPPEQLTVDLQAMKNQIKEEFYVYKESLEKYLNDYLFTRFSQMVEKDQYSMNGHLWAQIVYQFLYAFDTGNGKVRKNIVEAMRPLYLARTVTFDKKTWNFGTEQAEIEINIQAKEFLVQRPLFIRSIFN